jgi:8-oxo-dGTP diphosphatase
MIVIGEKDLRYEYDFRETCFGICYKYEKFYLTEKNNEIYLTGGGIESGESHKECLQREFLEEAGIEVTKIMKLCDIDCFWITRDNKHMESLTHIYVVEVAKEIHQPLETNSKLTLLNLKEAKEALKLPYQRKALEVFMNKYM